MWTEVSQLNNSAVHSWLTEMAKQRDHYLNRKVSEVDNYLSGKNGVASYLYDGGDFSVGVMVYWKDKTNMTLSKTACIGHGWYKGNVDWGTALDLMLTKVKEYAIANGCLYIHHIQPKNMNDVDLKITAPYTKDKNCVKYAEYFLDITIKEDEKNLYIAALV